MASSEQKYKQPFDEVWQNYFFALISNETICLLCGFKPSLVQKQSIERHYKMKHSSEYSKYVGQAKYDLIEGLKLVYQQSNDAISRDNNDSTSSSKNALTASFNISYLLANQSKPFTDGEFVKKCLIEATKAFGGSLTLENAVSIPLSDKTVASRVKDIASHIMEKLKSLIVACSFFSLCIDESTDNRHVSQLSIFVRIVQDDFSCVEELLDLVPLHGTTTGIDIFKAVEETLQKFNVDFSKCSAIVTDGAKAMTGSKIGFLGQLRQRNLEMPVIHCIIHQEALCGKVLKLCTAMQTVTKIINFIKGGHKFLNHRKFQQFLLEHNAAYTDVPLHCEVRWLSAGQCLEKFFAIRKEILLFLQELKFEEFKSFFENLETLSELAVVTDITNQLNILNLQLQKANQNVSQLITHIDSFRRKLTLLKNHLEKDIFHFYPCCHILFNEHGINCNFKQHVYILDEIINQFNTRFNDLSTLRSDLILFENPLTVKIEEQSLQYQEELCTLQNDFSLKSRPEKGVEFFKILDRSVYPTLRNLGLRIFSMFGSTYLCECSFSKMKNIKTDKRSSLNDETLSSLMRTSSSSIDVDIASLVYSKRPRKSSLE